MLTTPAPHCPLATRHERIAFGHESFGDFRNFHTSLGYSVDSGFGRKGKVWWGVLYGTVTVSVDMQSEEKYLLDCEALLMIAPL